MDTTKYDRGQLIKIVQEVMNCEGSEKEVDDKIQWLEQNIIDPKIIDYIF